MMIKRENKLAEVAIKRGIKLSKTHGLASAHRVMQQANLPTQIIQRVLNEPEKIRSTDFNQLN